MSTRGLFGFRVNGQDKLMYSHSDSYPCGLGADVLEFIRNTASFEALREKVLALQLIEEGLVSDYSKYRDLQGNLSAVLNLGEIPDSSKFALNSLFCEWAYVIDVDTEQLEVYRGFNQQRGNGRYDCQPSSESNEFFGVSLLVSFKLSTLVSLDPLTFEKLPKMIERLVSIKARSSYFDADEQPDEVLEYFSQIENHQASIFTVAVKDIPVGTKFKTNVATYIRAKHPTKIWALCLEDYSIREFLDESTAVRPVP